jgi:hypothetical protein
VKSALNDNRWARTGRGVVRKDHRNDPDRHSAGADDTDRHNHHHSNRIDLDTDDTSDGSPFPPQSRRRSTIASTLDASRFPLPE